MLFLLCMINEQTFPGVWGTAHIIYFVLSVVLIVAGLFLIKRYVKKEKTIKLIVKITALALLITAITNRIGYMVQYIEIEHREGYTWASILPETFCSVSSFCLSISVLCSKKDSWSIHGFVHMALIGALFTVFYPDFLDTQGLWEVGTMTSLIYHSIMLFLALLVIVTRYINLTMKKWYVQPLFFMIIICYGLFYWKVFNIGDYDTILGINQSLIKSQPILGSWWMIGIGYLLYELAFLTFYDHFVNKKDFKTIGNEFIHFYRYINQ